MPKVEVTSLPTKKCTESKHEGSGCSLIWEKYMPHTLAKVLLNNVLPRLVKTQALGLLKAHSFSL